MWRTWSGRVRSWNALSRAVEVGEVIAVRPGERVPLDGVVLEGASSLDNGRSDG